MLVELFTSPGILAEPMRIYLARDLSDVDAPEGFVRAGEEAHMDTVWAPLADLVDAVLAGRLHNPTLVSGVLAAWTAWQRDGFASLRPATPRGRPGMRCSLRPTGSDVSPAPAGHPHG